MRDRDYCIPEFIEGQSFLEISQGRHPVVEAVLKQESLGLAGTHAFVPNDCVLSSETDQISDYRSKYGRKIDLHSPSCDHYLDGSSWLCGSGEKRVV